MQSTHIVIKLMTLLIWRRQPDRSFWCISHGRYCVVDVNMNPDHTTHIIVFVSVVCFWRSHSLSRMINFNKTHTHKCTPILQVVVREHYRCVESQKQRSRLIESEVEMSVPSVCFMYYYYYYLLLHLRLLFHESFSGHTSVNIPSSKYGHLYHLDA